MKQDVDFILGDVGSDADDFVDVLDKFLQYMYGNKKEIDATMCTTTAVALVYLSSRFNCPKLEKRALRFVENEIDIDELVEENYGELSQDESAPFIEKVKIYYQHGKSLKCKAVVDSVINWTAKALDGAPGGVWYLMEDMGDARFWIDAFNKAHEKEGGHDQDANDMELIYKIILRNKHEMSEDEFSTLTGEWLFPDLDCLKKTEFPGLVVDLLLIEEKIFRLESDGYSTNFQKRSVDYIAFNFLEDCENQYEMLASCCYRIMYQSDAHDYFFGRPQMLACIFTKIAESHGN